MMTGSTAASLWLLDLYKDISLAPEAPPASRDRARDVVARVLGAGGVAHCVLPDTALVHGLWDAVISALQGRDSLIQYISTTLLQRQDDLWLSPWQSSLSSGMVPGYTAGTDHQSIERFQGILKTTLPNNFVSLPMGEVTSYLATGLRAVFLKRGWTQAPGEKLRHDFVEDPARAMINQKL